MHAAGSGSQANNLINVIPGLRSNSDPAFLYAFLSLRCRQLNLTDSVC